MNFRWLRQFSRGILPPCLAALLLDVGGEAADPGASPLPPVEDVLKRVVARAARDRENDRQFDARYEYLRVKIREVRTPKGKLKQRDESRRLNQPPGSLPAPADVNPDVAGTPPSEEPGTGARPDRIRSRGDYGKKDFPITDEMLGRFDFALAGREIRAGRPTLILDFQPASRELPVNTFLDRFINRMAGRLHVDEMESVIVRADLRLTETVTFVAGIAGAVYQLDCVFERTRTEDGLWYTPRMNWRADWRELFSRKVVAVGETKDQVRRASATSRSLNQAAARIDLP